MTNICTNSIFVRFALAGAIAIGLQGCLSGGGGSSPERVAPAPAAPEIPATSPPAPPAVPAPADDDDTDTAPAPAPALPEAPGGLIENSLTAKARGLLSASEIRGFLPTRGAFTFPEPYNTRGVRITNDSDCDGQDCVASIGYSYWRNINNHVHDDTMLIFLRLNPSRGGEGPTLFRYNKKTEEMKKVGPLFDADSKFRNHTGEGWYFSAQMPNSLYIRDNAKLVRYDVISKTFETVFDVTDEMGNGHYIWQMHSSNDDRVHSATVKRSSDSGDLGCIVYFEDSRSFRYFPKKGSHDECQIDRSGRWLVIKEDITGRHGSDNRIIDLDSGTERLLIDEDGAGGHSDMGYGAMIAADNWSKPNAQRIWDFTSPTLEGVFAYYNDHWQAASANHLTFSHARPDIPLNEQYACGSNASSKVAVHTNEIICFLLGDDSNDTLVVAPVMTDMGASGGGDSYFKLPKGNLDVTGQYFIWTTNMGGSRQDAFLVKIPAQKLRQ